MAGFNPYAQYQAVQYNTAGQGVLILKTYDAAIRFCQNARECMVQEKANEKGELLTKAFDIVAELRKSLRPESGGEIYTYLERAYEFTCRQITLANVLNNTENLDNALLILTNLRDAWREIVHKERLSVVDIG